MTAADDPWAPLPPEHLDSPAARPAGRAPGPASDRAAAGAPAVGSPAEAAAPKAPLRWPTAAESPPNPAGPRLLRRMQQQLAAPPRPEDPLADALRRHKRRERAAERSEDVGAAAIAPTRGNEGEAAVPAAGMAAPPAAADPARPAGAAADPREAEPWFARLPAAEQQRLRARWHAEQHRFDDRGAALRRRLVRATCHGALLLGFLGLLQAPILGFSALLPLVLWGAIAAFVAQLCRGGRFVFAWAGALAFVAAMGPTVLVSPLGLIGVLMCSFGLGVLGHEQEMRRSGGFAARD